MSEVVCTALVLIISVLAVQAVQINRTSSARMWVVWPYKARARILYGLYALYSFLYVRVPSGAGVCAYKEKPYIRIRSPPSYPHSFGVEMEVCDERTK